MIEGISDEAFDERVLKSAKPVLVDFRAEWCGPCQMLGPELEKIAASRADLDVVGVDVDKAPMRAAPQRHAVESEQQHRVPPRLCLSVTLS